MFLFQMANLVITPQLSARLVPLFRKNVFFIRSPLHFSNYNNAGGRFSPASTVSCINSNAKVYNQ